MDPITPTISPSQMPPDVRASGADGQRAYTAALAFESQLVQQMAQALASTAQDPSSSDDGSSGDGSADDIMSSSGDAGTSMYQQMLPDALTQGVTAAGGTGLAEELWKAMWKPSGTSSGASA